MTTTNVYALPGIFDAVNRNGGVYVCELASREPFDAHSDRNIERGKAILHVTKVLLGITRSDISLSYAYIRTGGTALDGPLVWPPLDGLGKSERLLCVIVPEAEDPSTVRIPGVDEAASIVEIVTGESDPKVQEMRTICQLYSTKGTPQFGRELEKALTDLRPAVRGFALQATVINLGETAPSEAIKILQTRSATYGTDTEGTEAVRLISFMERTRGHVEPWDKMNKFICRCLVTLAQSRSRLVRDRSLTALVNTIAFFSYRPDFRLQDGLSASEKQALRDILDSEFSSTDMVASTKARTLKEWLAH